MAEIARLPSGIGPRRVLIEIDSCAGCPAFRRTPWHDEKGEHITASCTAVIAVGEPKLITTYWRPDRAPPSWCPAHA